MIPLLIEKFLYDTLRLLSKTKADHSTFISVLSKLACTPSNTSAILFAKPALSKYGIVHQIWKIAVVFKEVKLKLKTFHFRLAFVCWTYIIDFQSSNKMEDSQVFRNTNSQTVEDRKSKMDQQLQRAQPSNSSFHR